MPLSRHNKRSAAPVIGIDVYLVVLAIAAGLGAAAVGEEADTAGPKILLLRGSRSTELDLASRRESGETDAVGDNGLRGDSRSQDAPVRFPSPPDNSSSPQRTNRESATEQLPASLPPRTLPEGLVSEPLRNFWSPGQDADRPAWQGRSLSASNRNGSEIQIASYVSESLPSSPPSGASREERQAAKPPHVLPQDEERSAPAPHLLLSISLVTSVVALGLAIAFRVSGPRRDTTIHVELASPPGTILGASPATPASASSPEASPARSTTIADFSDSRFAVSSILGPTFDGQRHAEQQQQKAHESAMLETLFEENLRLRQDLRKPRAGSTAVSDP